DCNCSCNCSVMVMNYANLAGANIVDVNIIVNERVRRLRMQHDIQAQALRHRIEMRINRIPKKMWSVQMKDLLLQHATGVKSAGKMTSQVDARDFVTDVKKLRYQIHSK